MLSCPAPIYHKLAPSRRPGCRSRCIGRNVRSALTIRSDPRCCLQCSSLTRTTAGHAARRRRLFGLFQRRLPRRRPTARAAPCYQARPPIYAQCQAQTQTINPTCAYSAQFILVVDALQVHDEQPPAKMARLAILEEREEDKYEHTTVVKCWLCDPSKGLQLPDATKDPKVRWIVFV